MVTDELGNRFAMKFTAPCPEFRTAKDFSLVTESYRNLDRFTAASVGGQHLHLQGLCAGALRSRSCPRISAATRL